MWPSVQTKIESESPESASIGVVKWICHKRGISLFEISSQGWVAKARLRDWVRVLRGIAARSRNCPKKCKKMAKLC